MYTGGCVFICYMSVYICVWFLPIVFRPISMYISVDWFKGKITIKSLGFHGKIWLVSGEDFPSSIQYLIQG